MVYKGNRIDAIIFDLGGVILNIDILGTFGRFKTLGIDLETDGMELIKHNNIFNRFERGELKPEHFRNEIRKLTNSTFSFEEFDNVWNSMILDYPKENIRLLEKAKNSYRTFLMSNTNQIHFDYYSKSLFDGFGYRQLDELFERAYYSHVSGMRKPEKEFFMQILKENNLVAANTLFIDDFPENIKAADGLGINTLHLTNGMKITQLGLN